ncbi:hypothetical protein ACU686_39490 [Yinghuangia aomiensis]
MHRRLGPPAARPAARVRRTLDQPRGPRRPPSPPAARPALRRPPPNTGPELRSGYTLEHGAAPHNPDFYSMRREIGKSIGEAFAA